MSQVSAAEMMIHLLAQEVRDHEFTFTGTLSAIPAAACYLAKLTHAPEARLLIFHSPEWPFESELDEFFGFAQQGRLDLLFLSGGQIDRLGSTNLVAIGPHQRPKVRLPGGAGSAMLCLYAKRTVLFLTQHSARSLVERVDFVTGPGGTPGPDRLGGPTRLVTDAAVFDYGPQDGLSLASIHPGLSFEDLQARTGFDLGPPRPTPTTPAPDERILDLIHGPVKDMVAGPYPRFAKTL